MPRKSSIATGRGFCKACNETTTFHWEDCGIGAYEYWGARGTDVDWQPACDECGELMDQKEIDVFEREPEWEPDLDDWRED